MAAGVSPDVVRKLQKWGADYTDIATRFQYSPKSSTRTKRAVPKKAKENKNEPQKAQ